MIETYESFNGSFKKQLSFQCCLFLLFKANQSNEKIEKEKMQQKQNNSNNK